jgi:hypothetical protein
VVRQWHQRALAVIDTKSFDETWTDFLRAYESARLPLGVALDQWARQQAGQWLPPAADDYDSDRISLLVGMCWHLAHLSPQRRFFLSSHRAGALLGISQRTALSCLRMLTTDGVIQLIERGNQKHANRYRYLASPDGAELSES